AAEEAGDRRQRNGDGIAAEVGVAAFEPRLPPGPPQLRLDAAADRPADLDVAPAAAAGGRSGVAAGQDSPIVERALDLAEGDAAGGIDEGGRRPEIADTATDRGVPGLLDRAREGVAAARDAAAEAGDRRQRARRLAALPGEVALDAVDIHPGLDAIADEAADR